MVIHTNESSKHKIGIRLGNLVSIKGGCTTELFIRKIFRMIKDRDKAFPQPTLTLHLYYYLFVT